MDRIIDGISRFKSRGVPARASRSTRGLARDGQKPQALMISCSDSRVVPEIVTGSGPGDLFVTRNAGNIVPPYSDTADGGVTSAIEYAVVGLGVEAHRGVRPHRLRGDEGPAPPRERWPRCRPSPSGSAIAAARSACSARPTATCPTRRRRACSPWRTSPRSSTHLRTHPCVAARVATGALTLHGWVFEIETGTLLASGRRDRRLLAHRRRQGRPAGRPAPRTSRGARRAEARGGAE